MKYMKLTFLSLLWVGMLPAMEEGQVSVEDAILNIARSKGTKPTIVSIAGCSSVGKTIFSKNFLKSCEDKGIKAKLVRLDHFLTRNTKPLEYSLQSSEFNNRVGNNSIWQFDHRRVHEVLQGIKAGKECVIEPKYNYETKVVDNIPYDYSKIDIVIVEGIYALSGSSQYDFAKYSSLKIFMDAVREDLLFDWYCKRRSLNKEDLEKEAVAIWDLKEDYEKVIKPSKKQADVILLQNEEREYSLVDPN